MIWSYNLCGKQIKSLNRMGLTENPMRQKLLNLLNNTENFINERRSLFFLLIFFAVIYLLIKGLSKASAAFLSFELALIFVLVGMAPAFYLRNIFPFRNIVGWLTNASMFSLIFIPLTFLGFGWLHLNLVFLHSINLLRILAVVSLLVITIFVKKDLIREYISFKGLSIFDYLFYSVIFAFTAILTLQNMTNYFPRWDVFTYWGLDAKYIFNFNKLHDLDLDVFWFFRKESSLLPILFSLVYDLYGRVVEQFASWMNVFIMIISMLLVYNLSQNRSVFQKLLILTALIVVGFTGDDTAFMFSLYGDVISAFLFLVFVLLLTANYEYRSNNYGIRLLLILLIPLSLYLVKSRFLFLAIGLPFVVLLYDIQFLRRELKIITRKPAFIVCLVVLVLLVGLFINFQNQVMGGYTLATGVSTFLHSSDNSLGSYFSYTKDLIYKLFNFSRYVTVLWAIAVSAILFVKKPLKNKKYVYSYALTIFGILVFVLAYINRQASMSSGSLIRYTSLVMFLIPSLFAYPDFQIPKRMFGEKFTSLDATLLRNILLSMLVFGIGSLFNNKIKQVAPVNQDFSFVGGSYADILLYHSTVAEKVLTIVEEDSRILIADDFLESNRAMNQNQTSIFIRYYLMNNSVGGQYRTTLNQIIPLAKRYRADYLLLISYENSFPNCETLLEGGKDYLIKLDDDLTQREEICTFSETQIYELSDQ